ncbi:NIPSNAP family protein [Phyllobacterium sp. YR531]|uniref:NIPSNAP family protein n=1 Tax=Phyllobacterium sp. YR531 TaxID=1144343 RepID=UPI00026F6460|nr:NIPSNAP family protein [Phyllobacterium sp. YR531]EJN00044.1 hypothetical protein PMI41_03940 [Phyllobacterium sp. YR531]
MDNKIEKEPKSRYSPVIELRRYKLHPNKRDELIDVFDRHFLEGQESCGMKIIGQFRDLDDPDAFVWLRGFDNMRARHEALSAFYDGPVWNEHRDAANTTMIDSDDVLLLRPAIAKSDFELPVSRTTDHPNISGSGTFQITTYKLKAPAEDGFLDFHETVVAPILNIAGDKRIALLTSEHRENTFTRLPVRLGENVLVSVSRFDSAAEQNEFNHKLANSQVFTGVQTELAAWLTRPIVNASMEPTSRSLLK